MKLNAVAVSTKNMSKTVEFYKILGFTFPKYKDDDRHVESLVKKGQTKLMIDTQDMVEEVMGRKPIPSNHSSFAIEYEKKEKINQIAKKLKKSGLKVVKEPWDAFWGQRYCVVQDPDGYFVDLYASLK